MNEGKCLSHEPLIALVELARLEQQLDADDVIRCWVSVWL
jgi:hypothetical protein